MRRKLPLIFLILVLFVVLFSFSACKSTTNLKDLQLGFLVVENLGDYDLEVQRAGFYAMVKTMSDKQLQEDNASALKNHKIFEETATVETLYENLDTMVQNGCKTIFVIGQDIEDYVVQVATENPTVDFCLANGEQAHYNKLPNYHTFTFQSSETSFFAGMMAGLKLQDLLRQELINDKMLQIGYLATADDVQNVSSYGAFYLGAKSICSDVKMKVLYLKNQTEDEAYRATRALIANNCILIVQQSNFEGVSQACEENGKYYFSKDPSHDDQSEFLIADVFEDWEYTYSLAIQTLLAGKELPNEWSAGCTTADQYSSWLNTSSFSTEEKYNEAKTAIDGVFNQIKDGTLHIFDVSAWTVDGKQVISTAVDKYYEAFQGEEFIKDGYFAEYDLYALPKFCFVIDGIIELNTAVSPADCIYR